MSADPERWPALPYAAWKDTAVTLHLWTQIVGKIRLALTPWLNHSWHVPLYVTARGLTTGADARWRAQLRRSISISSTMCCGCARATGSFAPVALRPMPVAEFYAEVMIALTELGIAAAIRTMPCEIADCIPFDEDTVHAAYDADAAQRFWRVLLRGARRDGAFPHRRFSARPARCISSGAVSIWR